MRTPSRWCGCGRHCATARALADAGLEFVVAPVATSAGTLRAALRDVRLRWDAGPLSDEARTLLAEHVADVLAALARHEAAAQRLRDSPGLLVVTHGEPHPGNTLSTAGRGAGGLKLRGPHRDTPDSRASLGYLRGVLQSLAALTPRTAKNTTLLRVHRAEERAAHQAGADRLDVAER